MRKFVDGDQAGQDAGGPMARTSTGRRAMGLRITPDDLHHRFSLLRRVVEFVRNRPVDRRAGLFSPRAPRGSFPRRP